jgi:hypothetical protein
MSSNLEETFTFQWRILGGPELEREHKFHPARKWRFDFCHLRTKTAIELEGGVWSGGRHTRGGGFTADIEKYNAATLQGYVVLRLTGEMLQPGYLERLIGFVRERDEANIRGNVVGDPPQA